MVPPCRHQVMWWGSQWSNRTAQPGIAHRWYMTRSARRCARLASRVVRAEVERLGWVTDLEHDTVRIDDDRHDVPAQGAVDDHRDRELDAVDTEIDVRVLMPSLDGGAEIDHGDRLRTPTHHPTRRRRRRSATMRRARLPVRHEGTGGGTAGLLGGFAEDECGEGEGAEVVLAFERVGGCGVADPGVEPCFDLVTQSGDQRLAALGIQLPGDPDHPGGAVRPQSQPVRAALLVEPGERLGVAFEPSGERPRQLAQLPRRRDASRVAERVTVPGAELGAPLRCEPAQHPGDRVDVLPRHVASVETRRQLRDVIQRPARVR